MSLPHSLFWLSDDAWAPIEPHMPKNQPGARRVNDQRLISGIIHMLKCVGRWADCPSEFGPSTTGYNRWNRWSLQCIWTDTADHLDKDHPLAATLILRSMIGFALDKGLSKRYTQAVRHLQTCGYLARRIEDWPGRPEHDHYVADLQAQHGCKSRFWNAE